MCRSSDLSREIYREVCKLSKDLREERDNWEQERQGTWNVEETPESI